MLSDLHHRVRYMSAGEEGEFVDEETGWKLIHGLRPYELMSVGFE